MKAEHRKQLETNTLADNLGKLVKGLKHGVSRNAWIVAGIVVVIFCLFLIWRELSFRSQKINATLWYKWDQLDDPEEVDKAVEGLSAGDKDRLITPAELARIREQLEFQRLESFAKQNSGTTPGRLARFQTARLALFEGLRDVGQTYLRESALKRLEEAATTYEQLAKDSRDLAVLHQEALLNCGKANESLGRVDEALKYYKLLKSTYPKSEVAGVADRELARLDKDIKNAEELSKDLSKVAPPPSPIEKP
jgi:tetratricopeptide (TPR) repeat protein